MRIGIAIDYGKYANSSSLNLIAKKIFVELGKMMNKNKSFTISAIKYEDIGIGDINMHYDCVIVPNMGGYKFPRLQALSCKNLIIGLSGIDEVILGEQVYRHEQDWFVNKPIIEKEVPKWAQYVDKIKLIWVPTNAEKEQMIKYLKIPSNKIHIISHGTDHDMFKPPISKKITRRKILGAYYMKPDPYLIHVSETNYARKNIFRMFEAYRIAREKGLAQKLIVVGKAQPEVYEKARSIDGIKVLGFVSEEHLIRLLQGADALIFPSLHEGFGLPLLESMACGTPVITSNTFSPPEVVKDGGLFVNPYDVNDIASKIIDISTNETLRKKLSERAYERSMSFSWEKAAQELFMLIEEKININQHTFNFEQSIDLAAYRTLTTVCELLPGLKEMTSQDLLEFDYSRIIPWAIEVGLENSDVKDFLFPFREWLNVHYDFSNY